MHIEDGILQPKAWGFWYMVMVVFIIPGIKEIKRRVMENLAYKPFLAMVGVAVFVISALHFPVPVTGSCSHPTGTALAAILVGPFATAVISAIVLFFQAIFLGHGGITTIGANDVSMGIAGAFSGYFCWKALRAGHAPIWLAAGVAGFVGDLVTYLVSAFELAQSLHGNHSLTSQWMIFFLGYAPTQVPIAIAESIFTATVLKAIITRRPDLLPAFVSAGNIKQGDTKKL
ncbi:cobalt uptake substrate-specific transmembrane region [Lucifera butyrica]|uniref:Cobalt transport protein CbiM n=1 Tax=Lucifera butyrica TaxID=1351585 RepID=A0A498RFI3_9FIRM|nr:energy-coupling factor ABC transporter permease [Lucifera butyrica]VBB09775.1 cobalt uptake substrate-specific transmembrane region [Lucifera butyrica]